jgi:hypothetical protein
MAIDMMSGVLRAALGGAAGQNKNFEPQRVNNALLTLNLGGFASGDAALIGLSIATMALPKMNNGIIEVGFFNEKRKFAGNAVFDDLSITVIDYIDTDVLRMLLEWKYKVYNPENGQIGLSSQYKATGQMDLFPPNGDETKKRSWKLFGVWPSNFDPGEIDMAGEDVLRANITLTIDKAVPIGANYNPTGQADVSLSK